MRTALVPNGDERRVYNLLNTTLAAAHRLRRVWQQHFDGLCAHHQASGETA